MPAETDPLHEANEPMQPQTLFRGRFLSLIREGRWEYAERVHAQGAVMIVAVTPENELLLVEEYRYPLHARTIGLPAGIAGDDREETLKEAAYRELIEETGYQPATLRLLCSGPSSPGLTSEIIHFFMAGELVQVSEGGGVDNENITVHRAPLDTIDQWIESQLRQGRVIDPRVYLALRFLHA